jgi:iron(III) transport system ATP-binding protein
LSEISLEDVVVSYPSYEEADRVQAVDRVSLSVREGSLFTLLGPSGCGKSSLLAAIAGLVKPDSGSIRIGGQVVSSTDVFVSPRKRNLGMVFQSYAVWPHMSVFGNVAYPLTVRRPRPSQSAVKVAVEETLELVGLAGLGQRPATDLSGGQQQRLALARALAQEPRCLLLDEPLSNLDAKLREQMRSEILRLHQETGVTMIYVTHDQEEALALSDTIAVMREGTIVQIDPPQSLYFEPANAYVAEFIGGANILTGEVEFVEGGHLTVGTPLGSVSAPVRSGIRAGDAVDLCIRPEDLGVATVAPTESAFTGGVFEGIVATAQFEGASVRVEATVGEDLWTIIGPSRGRDLPEPDERIWMSVTTDRVFAMPQEG